MTLSHQNCKINIEDNWIDCVYDLRLDTHRWRINLNETGISYLEGKTTKSFEAKDIAEFQFEMGNAGIRYEDIPGAAAYFILKDDPEPKHIFSIAVYQEYVLLNQTKAYEFCDQVLRTIGDRYGIPVNYKISIDTKKKQNSIGCIFAMLVGLVIMLLFLTGKIRL